LKITCNLSTHDTLSLIL